MNKRWNLSKTIDRRKGYSFDGLLYNYSCRRLFIYFSFLSRAAMNLLKYMSFAVAILAVNFPLSTAFADTVELPMLRTLAEPELRAETGIIQYQEDPQEVRALQHRVMKIQLDTQNFVVNPTIVTTLDIVPERVAMPDLNNLPLGLQQYVLAIARGLQSPDPREGLYIMLAPFGIDRNATNVQISREQISLGIVNR